tara:strand:- start:108 stop:359 length:252 start_codon:yes stop_codon:yes gene_type:complete
MIRLDSAITVSLKADYTAESVKTAILNISQNFGQVMTMSEHNQLNWTDFLLCIASELAYFKRGERPIQEQMIAEKIESLGGKL